jgi:hypothetical protein
MKNMFTKSLVKVQPIVTIWGVSGLEGVIPTCKKIDIIQLQTATTRE